MHFERGALDRVLDYFCCANARFFRLGRSYFAPTDLGCLRHFSTPVGHLASLNQPNANAAAAYSAADTSG